MNKFLLGLAGALLLSGSASAETWGLIGNFNDWNGDVELTQVGDNVYSVTVASLQGDFKFRADHGWDNNLGNATSINDINGNCTLAMTENGANFYASETLENVTLTINTESKELTVSGLPSDQTMPTSLYLVGEPAGGWSPDSGISMSTTDGNVFTWNGTLYEGQYFSFVTELNSNSDWDAFNSHRYGPSADGTVLAEGANSMSYPSGNAWKVATTGEYTLSVDLNALTLTATMGEPTELTWGLIGEITGWNSDIEMTKVSEGVYEVTVENLSGEFKFRANQDWALNYGASSDTLIEGNGDYEIAMNGDNFSAPTTFSKVSLKLDLNRLFLTVDTTVGVESVGADANGTVRYYNLQGQSVANPSNGVFIRTTDEGTSKVRLGNK